MINIINNTGNEKKDLILESLSMYENQDGEIKNKEFVQYRNETFLFKQQLMEENPTAFRVLDLLSSLCNSNNTIVISCNDIAEMLSKTERTIQRAIKTLKDYNFLTIIKYKKNNIYFINPFVTCNQAAETRYSLAKIYRKVKRQYEIEDEKKEEGVEISMELTNINKTKINKFKNENMITYKHTKPSGKITKTTLNEALDMIEEAEELLKKKKSDELDELFEGTEMETLNPEDFENMIKNMTIEE